MNVDTALDILTLEQAVKILKREHSEDPFTPCWRCASQPSPEGVIRWLTEMISSMRTDP